MACRWMQLLTVKAGRTIQVILGRIGRLMWQSSCASTAWYLLERFHCRCHSLWAFCSRFVALCWSVVVPRAKSCVKVCLKFALTFNTVESGIVTFLIAANTLEKTGLDQVPSPTSGLVPLQKGLTTPLLHKLAWKLCCCFWWRLPLLPLQSTVMERFLWDHKRCVCNPGATQLYSKSQGMPRDQKETGYGE